MRGSVTLVTSSYPSHGGRGKPMTGSKKKFAGAPFGTQKSRLAAAACFL